MRFTRSLLVIFLALTSLVGDFWLLKESGFSFIYRMSLDVVWNLLIVGAIVGAYWLLGGEFKNDEARTKPGESRGKSLFDI